MAPTTRGGIDIAVTVDGEQVDMMLSAIELTLMGQNIFRYLRDYMQPWMRQRAKSRFANEGDDASGNWEPLMEATEDIRESQGFPGSHPINRRTGDLENFMTRGIIDYTRQPDAASMFYPGKPPTHALRQKYETAQKGKSKPRTVARPVAAVSMTDFAYFMSSFSFWFARETQQKFGGSGGALAVTQ